MASEVESLGEALGKRDKIPNWWSEGELVDANNVKAEMEPFGPVKNASTSGMQAALIMFYSSRIYFENHLKQRLSASELEEISAGKNPYPAKHYESYSPVAPKPPATPSEKLMNTLEDAKSVKEEDVQDSEAEGEEETEQEQTQEPSDEDVSKEDASIEHNSISGSTKVRTEKEESREEDSEDQKQTEQDVLSEQGSAPEDAEAAEVKREGGDESDGAASDTETTASASTVAETKPEDSGAYVVADLCKVINKLKKRCLEDRTTALRDMYVTAVEERANRSADTAEQKSWLTILSLELSVAAMQSQWEETKKKHKDQLKRHKLQVNQHIKMQLYRLAPGIRNMPIEEFEKLGGTADNALKEIAEVNSEEALEDSAKVKETVRKTRRTTRKAPPPEVLETPAMPQASSTAIRRSRRNAAQASSAKTRALFEGTPRRALRAGEAVLFSANGSPVEIGPLITKTRTTRATRAGRPPVAPVPFADALSSLLSTQSQEDPEGLKEILLATARKLPPRRSKR